MYRTFASLLVAFMVALPAWAQEFPTKPVRIISPYPTGLAPDVAIRILGDALSKSWNQPVRGTPAAVIQRLNAAIAGALRQKDLREKFYNIGFEPVSSTPEAVAELVHSDLKLYGDLIARTGITAE